MSQRRSVLIGVGIPVVLVLALFTWGVFQNDGEAGRPGVNDNFGEVALSVEPFADFNPSPLNRNFVAAKDYFSLSVAGLSRFGIEPTHTFDDFPQKLTLGQGLVAGKVG